jgi:hypothetical protein
MDVGLTERGLCGEKGPVCRKSNPLVRTRAALLRFAMADRFDRPLPHTAFRGVIQPAARDVRRVRRAVVATAHEWEVRRVSTDVLASTHSRAQFLRRSATGLALVGGGGAILARVEGVALGQSQSDVDTAKAAYTAESLAVFVYTAARGLRYKRGPNKGEKYFAGGSAAYLKAALRNEKDHRKALGDLLGPMTPTGLRFQVPARFLRSPRTVLQLGLTLETAFVKAYMGAVKTLESNDLKVVAAQIGANEASHQGFFAGALGGPGKAVTKSLPGTETIPNTVKAIQPFIVR